MGAVSGGRGSGVVVVCWLRAQVGGGCGELSRPCHLKKTGVEFKLNGYSMARALV